MTLRIVDTTDPEMIRAIADLALSLDIRSMPEHKRAGGGFLTLPPTFGADSVRLLSSLPSVVALNKDAQPAGFMLASEPVADAPSPVIQGMQKLFAGSSHGHRDWAVYGPIGVAANHQGKGIAPMMFDKLIQQLVQTTGKAVIVGFVDAANKPSIGLHTHKLGFETVGEFEVDDKRYLAVMFDLDREREREREREHDRDCDRERLHSGS